MAVPVHIHTYRIVVVNVKTVRAICNHPECDHELTASEIRSYLDWIEKYRDGLKQIGADF